MDKKQHRGSTDIYIVGVGGGHLTVAPAGEATTHDVEMHATVPIRPYMASCRRGEDDVSVTSAWELRRL